MCESQCGRFRTGSGPVASSWSHTSSRRLIRPRGSAVVPLAPRWRRLVNQDPELRSRIESAISKHQQRGCETDGILGAMVAFGANTVAALKVILSSPQSMGMHHAAIDDKASPAFLVLLLNELNQIVRRCQFVGSRWRIFFCMLLGPPDHHHTHHTRG